MWGTKILMWRAAPVFQQICSYVGAQGSHVYAADLVQQFHHFSLCKMSSTNTWFHHFPCTNLFLDLPKCWRSFQICLAQSSTWICLINRSLKTRKQVAWNRTGRANLPKRCHSFMSQRSRLDFICFPGTSFQDANSPLSSWLRLLFSSLAGFHSPTHLSAHCCLMASAGEPPFTSLPSC